MTEPEIRAIAKLELKPGDTLICFIPRDQCTANTWRNITRLHEKMFEPSVKLILTSGEFRFGVLTGGKELP